MNKQERYPATPELDRLRAIKLESQVIGGFLDWLMGEKGYCIYKLNSSGDPEEVSISIETFLADYFEIDLKKVEDEKRAIIEWLHVSQ